jgi:hypothetical protein
MKITKLKIKNFRLLKEFQIDLEDDLSLVMRVFIELCQINFQVC